MPEVHVYERALYPTREQLRRFAAVDTSAGDEATVQVAQPPPTLSLGVIAGPVSGCASGSGDGCC